MRTLHATSMINVFIIAHAPLASALRTAALHAFPEQAACVRAYDVPVGDDLIRYEAEAESILAGWHDQEVLLATDVLGATPANLAGRLAQHPRWRALAGVNLPMLWRALNYRQCTLEEVLVRARDGALAGVQSLSVPAPQHQLPCTVPHDPERSHHQQ